MNTEMEFWHALDRLVAGSQIGLDRPKGSRGEDEMRVILAKHGETENMKGILIRRER